MITSASDMDHAASHSEIHDRASSSVNVPLLIESLLSSSRSGSGHLQALMQLAQEIDSCWAFLSASDISQLEILNEDEKRSTEERQYTSLILSKAFYHLGDYEQSLLFALAAGPSLVGWTRLEEWIQVLKTKAIDMFTANPEDPQLLSIIDAIVGEALSLSQYYEVIGIALSTGRINIFKRVIELSHGSSAKFSLLKHTFDGLTSDSSLSQSMNQMLSILATEFQSLGCIDGMLHGLTCWIRLRDSVSISSFITSLLSSTCGNPKAASIILQVVLFLVEASPRNLLVEIVGHLKSEEQKGIAKLAPLFEGYLQTQFLLEFSSRNNHMDSTVLMATRSHLSVKSSLHHCAFAIAQGISACGTTSDNVYRSSIDFISHATNWAKFTSTASLGVIHRGQTPGTLIDILSSYLPASDNNSSSPYSEGGALYALGLATAAPPAGGTGSPEVFEAFKDMILPHLSLDINSTTYEPRQHGAALAVGLLSLGSSDTKISGLLKTLLYSGSAVSGEAAAIGLGLLSLGDPTDAVELLRYATSTPPASCHDKVIRGIAIAVSLMLSGAGDKIARPIIDEMTSPHAHPELRAGAQLAIALAMVTPSGDATSESISRLLNAIGSDQNVEVRRSAAIALGFGLLGSPSRLLALTDRLLANSFSPHVRYGVCIALGIALANTGNSLAVRILTGLATKDPIDFVRQGAIIGLSLVMMNLNIPSAGTSVRRLFEKISSNRNEDPLAKFGAVLGQGIIDAGGKNSRLRLLLPNGQRHWPGVAGALLFSCYSWSWYPIAHMLSLALVPCPLLGVAVVEPEFEVHIPQLNSSLVINDPGSAAYVPAMKKEASITEKDTSTAAILSITVKSRARQAAKRLSSSKSQMDLVDINENLPAQPSNASLIEESAQKQDVVELSMPVRICPELIDMAPEDHTDPTATEACSDAIGSKLSLPSVSPTSCDEANAISKMITTQTNVSSTGSAANSSYTTFAPDAKENTSGCVTVSNFSRLLPRHAPFVIFEDQSTKTKCRFQPLIPSGSRFYLSLLFTVLLESSQQGTEAKSEPLIWIDKDFEGSSRQ
ncbi:proteasome regulatory particle base subunit [Mitosporidium daphniae]